jgi:long-chain acyl-CoA synthetase
MQNSHSGGSLNCPKPDLYMNFPFDKQVLDKTYLVDPAGKKEYTYRTILEKAVAQSQLIRRYTQGEKKTALVAVKDSSLLVSILAGCWMANITPAVFSPNTTEKTYIDLIEEFGFDLIISDTDMLSPELQDKKTGVIKEIENRIGDDYSFEVETDNIALLLFSSGTSGKQKCIPLSFGNFASNINGFAQRLGLAADNLFLCGSPLWHAHGLYNSFLTSFFLQATVIYSGQISVLNVNPLFTALSGDIRKVVFHITPSMIPILLMYAQKNGNGTLPVFYKVICGTSFLDSNSKNKLEEVYNIEILQQYGMTETLFMTINDAFSRQKPESVGQPLPGINMEIWDGTRILPAGESGSIRVQSDSCFGSYYKPAETENSFRDDFFYTGDIGYFDADRSLFITGREKDLIKKGGFSISANVITAGLMKIESITEAYTIGIRDASVGEEIYSFYIADEPINENEIKIMLKKEIPANLLPKKIFHVDAISKTATGKIMRQGMEELLNRLLNE